MTKLEILLLILLGMSWTVNLVCLLHFMLNDKEKSDLKEKKNDNYL